MKFRNFLSIKTIFIAVLVVGLSSCKDDGEPEAVDISVVPSAIQFNADGGTKTIQLTANGQWNLNNSSDWITVTPTNGSANQSLTVTALPNDFSITRNESFFISSTTTTREVKVSQSGIVDLDTTNFIPSDNTDMRDIGSVAFTEMMGAGWNVGNSLEAIGGETAWGNPMITQQLINSVKDAGFNTIRIPVAWSVFSDPENFIIDPAWMSRVEEVVDYVVENEMYAMLNIHWDGGWMQPTYADQDYVNERLEAMWTQIAIHFRDYNDYLLFAGTNEVHVTNNFGTPTVENYTVQNSFNQTFVNAVRSTGGRNTYRHIVIQGYNTNIDHTVDFLTIPTDPTPDRMMVEVHYYDPFEFALSESPEIWQWGQIADDISATANWGNEGHVDNQFQKMKTNFIDNGYGVILGEYGAVLKNVPEHETYRLYYTEYLSESMASRGLVPVYWDNGASGTYGFALFDRSSGAQIHPELIDAIVGAVQ